MLHNRASFQSVARIGMANSSPPTVHAEVYQLGLMSQIPIEVIRDRSERAANLFTQSSSDRDGRDTWFLNAERGIVRLLH
jgi:hypothetical protein